MKKAANRLLSLILALTLALAGTLGVGTAVTVRHPTAPGAICFRCP